MSENEPIQLLTEAPVVRENRLQADLSLLGVALIWGINIPIMKNGLDQIDDFVFNAVRLVVSAGVLSFFAIRERQRLRNERFAFPLKQVAVYSVFVALLYQLCFLMGVARTTSGNTALIIATIPIWTALLARITIGERIKKIAWCGLGVALVGTIVVSLQSTNITARSEHLMGNVFIFGAALMWAGGTVYSRPLLRRVTPLQLSSTASVMSLPIHLLVAAPQFKSSLTELNSMNVWLIILYAGVLSSGLALPMWNFGVRNAGAAHAAVFQNVIPLIAIIAAWITRGESITVGQVVGGGLILSGLAIMRIGRR